MDESEKTYQLKEASTRDHKLDQEPSSYSPFFFYSTMNNRLLNKQSSVNLFGQTFDSALLLAVADTYRLENGTERNGKDENFENVNVKILQSHKTNP